MAKNKYPGCNGAYPLEMAPDKAGWLFVVQGNGVACSVHSIEAPLPLGDLGTAANNHVKWWEQWEMSTTIGGNLEN